MSRDDQIRNARLVFYSEDIQRLDGELDGFLELSGARCVLLIDREGHLVTRRGEPLDTSYDAVSALIAGSFAATREMARLLGESEFTIMFHQGARDSIQLQLVGERTLMAVLFDERTNLGMVRFYAQESARRLAEIMQEIAEQERGEETLSGDYGASAQEALENLL